MGTKIKIPIIILIMLVSGIWLTECKKSNPSIIGVWSETSYKIWQDSNNIRIIDTTYLYKNSNVTFAFYANGSCVLSQYPSPIYYTYKVVGNMLTLTDTIGGLSYQTTDTIVSLTEHSLVLSRRTFASNVVINTDTTIYNANYITGYSR